MTQAIPLLTLPQGEPKQRLGSFIQWGEPGGTAGINHVHKAGYRQEDPWFDWSLAYIGSGNKATARSAFLRADCVGRIKRAISKPPAGHRPTILIPEALIAPGWFLSFAKAYINVLALYKDTRSPLKSSIYALSAFEAALGRRSLAERGSLEYVDAGTFETATQVVSTFPFSASQRYDIGKELEILAGLLQGGYHSKRLRLDAAGFRLAKRAFVFRSTIPQAAGRRQLLLDEVIQEGNREARMTNETVAAVGQAYRLSRDRFGPDHIVTAIASMAAIPLTTTSMRMSDFLSLRFDALFYDEDTGRHRINIYRPKINRYQRVPIPKKLVGLANELFENTVRHTAPARRAFGFYIDKFGDDFDSIDELYIPEEIRPVFEQPYFRRDDIPLTRAEGEALEKTGASQPYFGLKLQLKWYRGIEKPNDIFEQSKMKNGFCCLPVPYVKSFLESIDVAIPASLASAQPDMFVNEGWLLSRYAWLSDQAGLSIRCLFASEGRSPVIFGSTLELRNRLLESFKNQSFPHWPFTSSDRKLRLDEALVSTFSTQGDWNQARDTREQTWWKPTLMNSAYLLSWINYTNKAPPFLFQLLDIRSSGGGYPSFTIHDTRKHFQTTALLAGVNETFLDELSGRTSGPQSAHYDLRTPREIVLGSMDLYDPEGNSPVTGPVAQVAHSIPIVDRSAFLYQNAAPKQLTEVGGCTTSWSVNPCDMHGNCMGCNRSVWRKGDTKRLPRIQYLAKNAEKMISEGHHKLSGGGPPQPIERHIRQHQDVLERCNEIFAVEADPTMAPGTLVTFAAARGSLGAAELASRLREDGCGCDTNKRAK